MHSLNIAPEIQVYMLNREFLYLEKIRLYFRRGVTQNLGETQVRIYLKTHEYLPGIVIIF